MVFPSATVTLGVGEGWVLGEGELGSLVLGGTDVTSDVLERDGITITRGRSDEGSHVETSRCSLTFRNNSGDYSPRNPTGAYYGVLGRNTPIRVTVEGSARFHGVVSAWPTTWDKAGADVTAQVEAAGVMRRLSQAEPLASALRRGVDAVATRVGYWPCEDGASATSLGSGLSGHPAIASIGASVPAAFDGFVASAPIPTVGTGTWLAQVPTHSATTGFQVRMLLAVPAAGLAQDTALWRVQTSSGSPASWNLAIDTAGALRLVAYDSIDATLNDTGYLGTFAVNGKLLWVSVSIEEAGADVAFEISTLEVGATTGTTEADSFAAAFGVAAVGIPASVHINPGGADMGDTAVGHILVQNAVTSAFDMADQVAAYAGEAAATRILRLAAEEDVTVALVGTAADTTAMGPQGRQNALALMREAAAADLGILYEPRDSFGLTYRTRADLYTQEPTLALDYDATEVAVIESTDDDQQTHNDVTVKREGGASANAIDEDGTLGVDTIGRYPTDTTINVETDSQLPGQASWRLHLGTVDEARYPRLGVNLTAPAFTGDAAQTAAAVALDLGDKIRVTNPPAWLPPNNIEQLAQGFAETIRPGIWPIEATCTPGRPWDVGVYDDSTGAGESRYDTLGSELAAGVTSTATSLSVATTDGPLWSDADQPFDVNIGGERITVTAVTGASSPQTFTVTRSVNGVVKAHTAAAAVSLFKPAYYAL